MTITMSDGKVSTRIVRLQGGGLRFLDSHSVPRSDFRVVTLPFQHCGSSQQWRVTDRGGGMCTIQQVSSGRFLDAAEVRESEVRVVIRPRHERGTQLWRIEDFGGGFITIQQVTSGRFLEATVDGDFTVVAQPIGNSEQTWRIDEP